MKTSKYKKCNFSGWISSEVCMPLLDAGLLCSEINGMNEFLTADKALLQS